jgi:hypothetical protein
VLEQSAEIRVVVLLGGGRQPERVSGVGVGAEQRLQQRRRPASSRDGGAMSREFRVHVLRAAGRARQEQHEVIELDAQR